MGFLGQNEKTRAEWELVISSIGSPAALVEEVKHRTSTRNATWLEALLKLGHFDVYNNAGRYSAIVRAFHDFLGDAHLTRPPVDAAGSSSLILAVKRPDLLKGFFPSLVARLIEQADAEDFNRDPDPVDDRDYKSMEITTRRKTFCLAMMGACALGLEDCLLKLCEREPAAMHLSLDLVKECGSRAHLVVKANDGVLVTPYFIAMQFSSTACMQILRDRSSLRPSLGTLPTGGVFDCMTGIGSKAGFSHPTCTREAFAMALYHCASLLKGHQRDKHFQKLANSAVMAPLALSQYMEAMVEHGIANHAPGVMLHAGLKAGLATVVQAVAPRSSNEVYFGLEIVAGCLRKGVDTTGATHNLDEAFCAFFTIASNQGAFEPSAADEMLIRDLVQCYFYRSILALVEGGLDPHQKLPACQSSTLSSPR